MLAHAGGVPETVATVLAGAGFVFGWIGLSRIRGRGFSGLPRGIAFTLLGVAPIVLVASLVVPTWLGPKTAPGPRPSSTATIAIVRPEPGAVVGGGNLEIALDLEGGRVVEATTTDIRPDTGHLHVYLDGDLLSMTYGTRQDVAIDGLAPGPHELVAEYVAADHAPFSPAVTASVTFVKADR